MNILLKMGKKENTPAPQKFPRRKKIKKKTLLGLSVLILFLAGGTIGIRALFFTEEEQIALTGTTTYGSLNEAIEGSGTTTAADSVTYDVDGTVLEWYVSAGDYVEAGDLLYVLDSSEAEDEIVEYEVELEQFYENLADVQENIANQTVCAPFSGRIEEISVEEGDTVNNGAVLAQLIDDSYMKTTLYFNDAYQSAISPGMSVQVSVPDQMLTLTGTVAQTYDVDYVTPEGLSCFAVEIQVANPGSLTEGVSVTCWLTDSDGSELYAATDGSLQYCQSATLSAKTNGEILSVAAVDYQHVDQGATLFSIDTTSYTSQLESLQKQIENTEKNIADLEQSIATEYSRYSDISGKVITADYSNNRITGNDMGTITIYNMESMEISINVDELDADYLTVGMPVTVYRTTSSDTEYYDAELTYLSLEATSSTSGVSTFAATITIPSNDQLSAGVTVYYSIDTGGSEEAVLAPVQALCSYDDGYYLLVQGETAPEDAIDPAQAGGSVTDYPEGYYAVPVEVGDANEQYIQILSGVEEGATVFLRYQNAAPTGGDTTSQVETEETSMPSGGPDANFPGAGNFGNASGNFGSGPMGNMPGGNR